MNVVTLPAPTNVPSTHSCFEKIVILSFLSEFWVHAWVSKPSYLWEELERESSGGIIGIGEGTKAAVSHNHNKVVCCEKRQWAVLSASVVLALVPWSQA